MKKIIPVLKRIFPLTFFIFLLAAFFAYPFISSTAESAASGSISTASVQSGAIATASASLSTQATATRSLWVGEENTVIAVSLSDGQPGLYISTKHVEDIAVDNSRGVAWVGTRKEIIQYKFDGTENFRYPLKHGEHSHTDGEQEGHKDNRTHCSNGEKQDTSNNHTERDDSDCEKHTVRISLDPFDGSLWIGAGKRVVKLSSDNRELFTIAGFDHIQDVSVDISDSSCWVGEKHKVGKYAADGSALLNFSIDHGNKIIALAADPMSHSLWIGTKSGLIKTDATGQELLRIEEPLDIQDVKVNTATGSVYLVTKKKVYKYTKDGQKLFVAPLCSKDKEDNHHEMESKAGQNNQVAPACSDDDHDRDKDCEGDLVTLAVDSTDDTCWIASRKTLFKLNNAGDLVLRLRGYIQIQALDIGLPKIGITITEPQDGAVFDASPITVRGIITDPTATVDVNGTKATTTNLDFEATGIILTSGTNTITATATNLARQKATDTISVTYTPQDSGSSLLLCVEPFREQTPRPPSEGCTQRITERMYALVTGLLDETAVTVTLNNVLLPEGVHIFDQGDIVSGFRQGTFFWAFVRLPVADGPALYTAIATDAQGGQSSAIVTVIKDATAPNVFITSPPDGTITNSQTITITGTVDDPTAELRFNWSGATITVVNGVFSALYDLGAADGFRYITITAEDLAGNSNTVALNIIRDATLPQIDILAPADGAVTNSQTITVAGTVIDQNPGTIMVSVNSGPAQLLASSGTNFSGTASLMSNSNSLLFTATDRAGNTSTLSRNVTLDQDPPTATVVGIEPNAVLTGTATITVTATDAQSGIQSVTLLVDGILKTTLTQGPYTFNLDSFGLSAGNHTITIRVLDRAGNMTEHNIPVTVQHQFGIQITSPTTGTSINKSSALIRGTISYPSNQEIGVTVNGIPAEQQGTNFAAIVPLQQGQNTITAIATNIYGIQEQATITINADNIQDQLRFTVSPASGITMQKADGTFAFDTTMNIESYVTGTIASYAWDTNGDGTAEQAGATLTQITASYQAPGLYFPTITVTDTMGNIYTDTAIVNVLDRNTMDALLKAKWEGMKGALLAGNIETALTYFVEGAKDNYRNIFAQMGSSKINSAFSSIVELKLPYLTDKVANCEAIRLESNGRFSYPVDFVKDQNGVWKILGF